MKRIFVVRSYFLHCTLVKHLSYRQLVIVLQREPQGLTSLERKVSEPWKDEALKVEEKDD